jgi:hypothetical protein
MSHPVEKVAQQRVEDDPWERLYALQRILDEIDAGDTTTKSFPQLIKVAKVEASAHQKKEADQKKEAEEYAECKKILDEYHAARDKEELKEYYEGLPEIEHSIAAYENWVAHQDSQ